MSILLVFVSCPSFAQKLTRQDMKCLTVPMYYPGAGIRFNKRIADDTDYLNPDMLRMEFIAELDGSESINYPAYDYIVDQAGERGLKILGLIDYASQPIPENEDTSYWGTEAFREAFVSRTIEIVEHYHDREHPIKHWEVWNEPDLSLPEFDVRIEPEPYAEILIECYDAIKAIDPEAMVIFGGISPKGFEYTSNYLEEVYDTQAMKDYKLANGYSPFDAVGAHPYPEIFSDPTPALGNILNNEIKAVMNANGDAEMKVWLTEMGWSSFFVTEGAQAFYLTDSFFAMDTLVDPENPQLGPYIEKYFWFQYEDFSEVDKWGLWTQGMGTKKPTYNAFLNLTDAGPEPPPDSTEPGDQAPVWNVYTDGPLEYQVSNNDLVQGMTPQIISGAFHPANVGSPALLTDGQFNSNGASLVLADFAYPSLHVRFEFSEPVLINSIRSFAAHQGDTGNRAFQNLDVIINGELAVEGVTSGNFGQKSQGDFASSVVSWEDDSGVVATGVTSLEIRYWCVSTFDIDFRDQWSPITDPQLDQDGNDRAYMGSIIKEIDVLGEVAEYTDYWTVY